MAAIEAVRALADRIRPVLQVCEIRTIAADRLWMSPQYGRDSVGIHFTWALEPEAVAGRARRPRAGARAVRPRARTGASSSCDALARTTSACPTSRASPRRSIRAARSGTRGSKPGYWVTRMTATTFGIIGSGWRSEFFLRLARAAPDRLRVDRRRQPLRRARRRDQPRAGARPRSSRSRRCCARRRPTSSSRASPGRRCPTPRASWSGSAPASSPRRRPRRTCPACGRSGPTSATAASSRSPSSTC